ncbi:protein Mis18-beta-like [Seriola dumerili]|uniref:protein Mis18-beta-like n=1 Tax=Seriola dumerili TaxID=41447 RepID=UPI000BBEDC7D|nr:protein Mis18-beta-like [Seriola dumerili]
MEYDESLLMQRFDDFKLITEARHEEQMTLHCARCNTVLGDSFSVCGEIKCMDSIMCLRVTNDVVISDAMESGHTGVMANCIYSSLKCCGCRCAVGRVIHSAPPRLDVTRSLFLLYKANISCYILNNSSMVKASTLTFDMKPLREKMNEVKQQFEAQLDLISRVRSRLSDRSETSELDK